MSNFCIYHNPRCSKSRATLALLQENGVEPQQRLYLKSPPSVQELRTVLRKLDMAPFDLLRRGEEEYASSGLSEKSTEDEILAAMAAHPKLIERPIVVVDDRAVLGRPPENVLPLLA